MVALFFIHATLWGDEPSAEQFAKSVVKSNVRLRSAGFEFGKQLGPILGGNPADAAALATTYAKLVKTLSQIKDEMGTRKFPDSEEAINLFAAYQQFLQGQTAMVTGDLADVLVIAVDTDKNADEKKTQIEQLLEAMTNREKADSGEMSLVFQAYVEAYKLDANSLLNDK